MADMYLYGDRPKPPGLGNVPVTFNRSEVDPTDPYDPDVLNAKVAAQLARTKRYFEILQQGGQLGC
jgi:hypothetical protein